MTKELKKRIFTSIVLLTIVLSCLYINNYSWLILLFVVSFFCCVEFFNIIKKIRINLNLKIILIISSISLLFLFIYSAYKIKVTGSPEIVLFLLLVCIFSDIGGYVVGKTVGGKKLTKISPNKTISGSFGSFLFSLFPVGIFLILHEIIKLDYFILSSTTYFENTIIIICVILSFVCQIGDLIISYFKRMAKVKDTGRILPGHGGFLDRIDGTIFAIPAIYYLQINFTIIHWF
tara:strand:- start:2897 stop:3595 length:699 start_codon:yes stop_codon:yes gene_type:complete